jgi:hypothetical protein
MSAVDIGTGILLGRPAYGGTANLYRKDLANLVKITNCAESRIETLNGPFSLLMFICLQATMMRIAVNYILTRVVNFVP